MSLFQSPKNYRELLGKLSTYTAFFTFIFMVALKSFDVLPLIEIDRELIPPIDEHKEIVEWLLSFGGIPIAGALIAVLLSRVFELHNKLALLTGLRKYWDKKYIIMSLYKKIDKEYHSNKETDKKIMNHFFYPQLKSIDPHYVELFWHYALPFWVSFEHLFIVLIVNLIVSLLVDLSTLIILTLWGYFILILIITILQFFFVLTPKTIDEVEQIDSDSFKSFLNGVEK